MTDTGNGTTTEDAPEIRDAFTQLDAALHPPAGIEFAALVDRRRHRRRRAILALAIVGCLAAGGASFLTRSTVTANGIATPAAHTSDTTHGDAMSQVTDAEFTDYQEQVMSVARTDPNFTNMRVDRDVKTLVVYGVGDEPRAVADVLAQAPAGVSARWESSPYSREQLDRAQRALDATIPRLVSIHSNDTYTGLVAGVATDLTEERVQQLEQLAARATDIPVTFVHDEPPSMLIG